MAGKGDNLRQNRDDEAYRNNYDEIFRKNEIKANKLLINNDVKLTEKGDDGLVKEEEC